MPGEMTSIHTLSTQLVNAIQAAHPGHSVRIIVDIQPKEGITIIKEDDIIFQRVVKTVASAAALEVDELITPRRYRRNAEARMIAYKILRERYLWTVDGIAKKFGRHHSTVIHALTAGNQLIWAEIDMKNLYNKVITQLNKLENEQPAEK
jgi:chromosomal replication initiation ATPase DnaA